MRVELRWLVRTVPRPRGMDDGIYTPPLPDTVSMHVLQYRLAEPGGYYGEWHDVPTVQEA